MSDKDDVFPGLPRRVLFVSREPVIIYAASDDPLPARSVASGEVEVRSGPLTAAEKQKAYRERKKGQGGGRPED